MNAVMENEITIPYPRIYIKKSNFDEIKAYKVYSQSELSAALHVSEITISRAIGAGHLHMQVIPGRKKGLPTYQFTGQDIIAWVNRCITVVEKTKVERLRERKSALVKALKAELNSAIEGTPENESRVKLYNTPEHTVMEVRGSTFTINKGSFEPDEYASLLAAGAQQAIRDDFNRTTADLNVLVTHAVITEKDLIDKLLSRVAKIERLINYYKRIEGEKDGK